MAPPPPAAGRAARPAEHHRGRDRDDRADDRNSFVPCSSCLPTCRPQRAPSPGRSSRSRRGKTLLRPSVHDVTPWSVDSSSVGRRRPAVVAAWRDSSSASQAICRWLLRAMPGERDWRTVRCMRALRIVRDHADIAFALFCTVAIAERDLVRELRDPSPVALAARPARDGAARVPVHPSARVPTS